MDDVSEGIPIGEVLRILGAEDDTVPELNVATLAPRHLAHEVEDGAKEGKQAKTYQNVTPRRDLLVPFHRLNCITFPNFFIILLFSSILLFVRIREDIIWHG